MPDEKVELNPPTDPKVYLQVKKLEAEAEGRKRELEAEAAKLGREAGLIGRVVGSPKNAPYNIAFLILVLTFSAGFVALLALPSERIEFWKMFIPIITFTLGYVFGAGTAARDDEGG